MIGSVVVTSLAAKLRAALPATVSVYDGTVPQQQAAYELSWVSIGSPWDDDEEPVTVDRVEVGAAPHITETFNVSCLAYGGDGGSDMSVPRGVAAQSVAAVDSALRGDRTLGGVVARARLGEVDRWRQFNAATGVGVMLGFTVEVTVFG